MTEPLEYLARALARDAHRGQVDKSGAPYITHPERVALRLGTAEEKAVAWLHDVVEDTDFTLDDLRFAGMPEEVVLAVEAITHRTHEPRADYYRRVRANPLALLVKVADISDNLDPARLATLSPETRARLEDKYAKALATLLG